MSKLKYISETEQSLKEEINKLKFTVSTTSGLHTDAINRIIKLEAKCAAQQHALMDFYAVYNSYKPGHVPACLAISRDRFVRHEKVLSHNAGEPLLKHYEDTKRQLAEAQVEIERVKAERNKAALLERQKYLPKLTESVNALRLWVIFGMSCGYKECSDSNCGHNLCPAIRATKTLLEGSTK